MIDREHALPLAKQAKALSISRGTLYYVSRPVPAADLTLMRRIDELHLEYPFAGSRMMQGLVKKGGFSAGRLHVARLTKRMGIAAIWGRIINNTTSFRTMLRVLPYGATKAAVRRQHLWDQIGDLNNGGFLAHRNPKESEDEPEILRPTHAGAS